MTVTQFCTISDPPGPPEAVTALMDDPNIKFTCISFRL